MAIAITKVKKEAPAPLEKAEVAAESAHKEVKDMTLEELADQYGHLQDVIAGIQMNPAFTQFDMVKKELNTRLATEMEPEDTAELQGEHWMLEIGACSKNARKIKDVAKIAAFVGQETFAAIAKVNIADCEKYLTPAQLEIVIESDTGYGSAHKIEAKFLG